VRFFNRELSWLEFNYRVLREGMRNELSLAERLRFLGIATENFDEFCMVRFAGLKQREAEAPLERDPAGLPVAEQLQRISRRLHELADLQARALNDEVLPRLAEHGLLYVPPAKYTPQQRGAATAYFDSEVLPLLTPLRVSRSTAQQLSGRRLHAAFLLHPLSGAPPNPLFTDSVGVPQSRISSKLEQTTLSEAKVAVVQIPANLPRVVRLPRSVVTPFALLDDIVATFGTALFPGYTVEGTLVFRLLRDADMPVDEDAGEAFLYAMEDVLSQRERSVPACLW
jgi:polyphosphate kinase